MPNHAWREPAPDYVIPDLIRYPGIQHPLGLMWIDPPAWIPDNAARFRDDVALLGLRHLAAADLHQAQEFAAGLGAVGCKVRRCTIAVFLALQCQ